MIFCKGHLSTVKLSWKHYKSSPPQQDYMQIHRNFRYIWQAYLKTNSSSYYNLPGLPRGPSQLNTLVSLSHRGNGADCHTLVEKITTRISTWTTRHLSYAGRLQLINSVIFSLRTYWSSMFILPKKIIKQIEALCRNFLWSQTIDYQKAPQVTWDTICQPKVKGGLVVKNYQKWNKHVWSMIEEKQSLWVKWTHEIYLKGAQFWQARTLLMHHGIKRRSCKFEIKWLGDTTKTDGGGRKVGTIS